MTWVFPAQDGPHVAKHNVFRCMESFMKQTASPSKLQKIHIHTMTAKKIGERPSDSSTMNNEGDVITRNL